MSTWGRWASALVMTAALLGVGAVRADEGDGRGEAAAAPRASLFPFGVRTPEASDSGPAGAVTAGLGWLAAHQGASGLWNAANVGWCNGKQGPKDLEGQGRALYDAGVTGMAVSAFLAAGHTHESGAHARVVAKALKALAALQDKDGCFGPRVVQHYIYNHAFAALALVEAYGETGDPRLLPIARKGLAFSEQARNPDAAWRYGVRPGDNDTSVTGCVMMSLCAARRVNQAAEAAGREAPFKIDPAVYAGVRGWLDAMTDPDYGRAGYLQRGGLTARPAELIDEFPGDLSEACTGIGMFLRAVLPGGEADTDAAQIRKGAKLLADCLPRWAPKAGNIDLYYWYYGSLAMDAVGGRRAERWRRALEAALVSGQRKDTDVCTYRGSWNPAGPWGPDGGRTYATAMAVLCLSTPHRFPRLPPDRSDLVLALEAGPADPDATVRLLDALALYRPAGAGPTLLPFAGSNDARIRAATAAALARCEPTAEAVRALGRLLADPSPATRREAAAGLALLGGRASTAAEAIRTALADEDARVRRHALGALGHLPDVADSVAAIRIRLTDPDPRVRVVAAALLRRLQPDDADARALLLESLKSEDAALRADAASGLGEAEPIDDAVELALQQRLRDPSPRVQVAAARGLVSTATDPAALLAIMEPCLSSPDLETRRLALQLAERLGPRAAPVAELVLAAALRGATPVRVAALRALAGMGMGVPGTVAVLFTVRDDGPLPVRDAAREGLERIGGDGEAIVGALIPGLGSTWAEVVAGAVLGLGEQGEEAVEPLRALLAGGGIAEQVGALRALTAVGPKAASAVSDVEKLLEEGTPASVVAGAARFLGAMCRRARCATDRLAALAGEGPPEVRQAAIEALGSIGAADRGAVEVLGRIAALRRKADRAARIAALRVLVGLGEKAEPALDALRLALSTNDGEIRAAGVDGMAAVGRPAVEYLLSAMEDRDLAYANAAMRALGKMGRDAKKAVPVLAEVLPRCARRGDWTAAQALAGIGKPAVRKLIGLLKDGNSNTRLQAAWALGRIGEDARSATSTLKRALKDDEPSVRDAAKAALENIRGG